MTALLTDNLPLLAGAPNGVKKLRELILELAVRGKLVPQDPSDEPASELLKRIAEEKARLVAEGKVKKQKPLPEIVDEELLFALPRNWSWIRLGDLLNRLSNGYTGAQSKVPTNHLLTRIETISQAEINYERVGFCMNISAGDIEKYSLTTGDILLSHINSDLHLGKTALYKGEHPLIHGTNLLLLRPSSQVSSHFIDLFLTMRRMSGFFLSIAQHAIGQASINQSKVSAIVIALPPIAEQHRIVAKVDELMALCDRLEAQQADAESAHAQLVQALLDSLTQTSDATDFATDFAANWQRLAEHFHTLFTTEPSIDALKQTLLQLAVMGKLVPQDPCDEPASELYKKITIWKEKLVKEKIYQKTATLKSKSNKYTYPNSWLKVQIGEICPSIVPIRDKPKSFSGGIPWVTLSSFPEINWFLDESKPELGLSSDEVSRYGVRTIPQGSVMMSCIGRFGLATINRVPVVTNQQIHSFVVHEEIAPEFLVFVIKVAGAELEGLATSTTIAYLNKSNCESIELGLPPFAEQHRIVAKIDQLMALCDQLKNRLTQARQLNEQLASTLVEQAVA